MYRTHLVWAAYARTNIAMIKETYDVHRSKLKLPNVKNTASLNVCNKINIVKFLFI